MKKKYKEGYPTRGLFCFLLEMQKSNFEFFSKIVVSTRFKEVTLFCRENLKYIIPCEIGKNGSVDYIDSKVGDGKTPICETKVRHIDMPTENIDGRNSAVFSKTLSPPVNFGPCFVCLYVDDPKTNKIRGIGFHGSEDDRSGLTPTDGGISISNANLYLIRKYFFKNQNIYIK